MRNKAVAFITISVFLIQGNIMPIFSFAEMPKKDATIHLISGAKEVVINDKKIMLSLPIMIKDGRSMVEFKQEFFTILGAKYNEITEGSSTYTIIKRENIEPEQEVIIKVTEEKIEIKHNGKSVSLTPSPYISKGSLLIPISQFYELLEYKIEWVLKGKDEEALSQIKEEEKVVKEEEKEKLVTKPAGIRVSEKPSVVVLDFENLAKIEDETLTGIQPG